MQLTNPFATLRDSFQPLIQSERLLLGLFAATAIAGTTAPILWPQQPKEVKLIENIWGLFSSVCFTAECHRRRTKEKTYQSYEDANLAIVKEHLQGTFAFERSKAQIESKRSLAEYVNNLPIQERLKWVELYPFLQGLVELPQLQQAVIEQPKRLSGSTIPNPDIAEVNEDAVQAIVNPGVMSILQELSAQYPEYIRLDDQWVDELCDSSACQDMGKRANHHFSFWGETQSGKSTLAGVFINKIAAKSQGAAMVFGSDPKNFVTRWLCKFSRKFDGFNVNKKSVLDEWVTFATKIIDARQSEYKDNRKGEGLSEIFLIQDEVNVVYGEGDGLVGQVSKKTAINLCAMWNYVITFTAGMKIHGIFMGQNPLSGYTGFSRPSLKNLCFITLGKVSGYVLSNPKDFLNLKSEIIELLKNVCELLDREEVRYALVVPTKGNPYIALIPIFDIDAMEQTEDNTKPLIDPYELLTDWIEKLGRNPSDDELIQAWQQVKGEELTADALTLLKSKLGL